LGHYFKGHDAILEDGILKNAIPMMKSLSNTKNDKNNGKYTNPIPIPIPNPSPDSQSHIYRS